MPAVASQYLLRMAPVITERFEPEWTLLELFLKKNSDKSKGGRDHHDIPGRSFRSKASETAESIGLKPPCTRDYLNDLISGGHRDQGRESKTPPLFASLISMRTLLGFAMVMASHSLMTTPSPGSSLREPLIPLRNILSRPGGCCAAKAMAISYRRNLNRFSRFYCRKSPHRTATKPEKPPKTRNAFSF